MLMLDGMPAVRVKAEPLESQQGSPKSHSYPDMEATPLRSKVKPEAPPEPLQFHTQTEPVDLSINRARTTPPSAPSPAGSAPSPSCSSSPSSSSSPSPSPSVITSAPSAPPTVLTPAPLGAAPAGIRGQQFLHIIHPVPPPPSPAHLQSSMLPCSVVRIPGVVRSVPLMYTTVRSPGNINSTIMLPLLEEGRSQNKGRMDPNGVSPRHIKSDSEDDDLPNVTLDSVNETGSTALSIARAVQDSMSPFSIEGYILYIAVYIVVTLLLCFAAAPCCSSVLRVIYYILYIAVYIVVTLLLCFAAAPCLRSVSRVIYYILQYIL
ncbi:Krueppel-like factor 12 isoform X2 [Anguilla anguilla]|uniref:Krueppel-like factor 12 isoform X2 n=1 Tax=Anguilla anguilla TaxID=7936 RepID=UPI0015A90DBC|nr:Krueppel-like factor 12 isoform X2 [Anguilla anguilla]